MPRTTPILTNFTAGEISPLLAGRVDVSRYFNATRQQQNMVSLPQGPAVRRPGTQFIARIKNSAVPARLLPFEFSTEQAYVLEFGPTYARFYKDGGRIETTGTPVELATPYLAGELATVKWTQSADVMTLVCPARAPHDLSRTSHVAWTIAATALIDGPYDAENTDTAKTLAPAATTGTTTITASGHTPFAATDVGRLVRIKHGSTWGYAAITAFTSSSLVTVTVKKDFGDTAAVSTWRLGLWSNTTGWPAAVCYHEERQVFGGSGRSAQRIDGSKSNDFVNFTPGTADGDPFGYTIGADKVNAIRWLTSWRQLIVGTLGAEIRVGSDAATSGLTPTNPGIIRRETTYGCADTPPALIGSSLTFVQRQRRKVRSMNNSVAEDALLADDMTELAAHVTRSGVAAVAYQQEPHSVLWGQRNDGTLIGCTYGRAQQVVAWHRHPLGGTDARVESMAVIPGAEQDELWMIVARTINGATARYVERLTAFPDDDTAQADLWFVDSGLSWDGAPATTFSGMDHLEGETVHILADGAVHPPRVVTGGAFTLDWPASKVIAGLPYLPIIETMPLEAGQNEGTAQSKRRRVDTVTVRLHRSLGCRIGCKSDALDEVPFRTTGDRMDAPPPLFTGDKTIAVRGDWTTPTVIIDQPQPLPLTVIAIMPRITAHD